ncbi:unnamed protein product [Rotaria magnacalcarata]|uniref:HAT C-terminal dimerisation domain-containing protein n=2 Tax=Rotaria magnacalcarata TaxID=392030 RepID=A0A816DUT5_9BILA|nr:unnamed protein product [Rotaria magnacalcarata]
MVSMSQLLESINRSYGRIKKILGDRKKVIVLDKLIILQRIILLRPFQHIILFLQKGQEPTLHLVTIAILTLRDAFNTHKSLLEYGQSYQENPSGEEPEEDDEYLEESERMIHKTKHFGEDFETGNASDEFDDEYDDELNKYIKKRIDINSIKNNPLTFWYENRFIYPILSQRARFIFSISATTANVERQFSAGGLMVNSRPTRLNPQQINNSLLIRSVTIINDCY